MRALGGRALGDALQESRQYTKALVDDLTDAQWDVPMRSTINPVLWELGHVGWFMERWCLRNRGDQPSLLPSADRLYDSSVVAHGERWHLPLPSRSVTWRYVSDVLDGTLEALARAEESDDGLYFFRLALCHEDMHAESFAHTRQTLGYPVPACLAEGSRAHSGSDDAWFEDTESEQGMPRSTGGFVFDNEKWLHPVRLRSFAISRRPVLQGEFLLFVEDGGYRRDEFWEPSGRAWRAGCNAANPVYWRRIDGRWEQREFDRWRPLSLAVPMKHVTAHEAEAYCRWAGRRLPTESEWEHAAASGAIEWGNSVWEWTASAFGPYPGFGADAYRDYSAPWFHTHRSVRGGSVATTGRLLHPRFRNFYEPHRSDVLVGFRTAA